MNISRTNLHQPRVDSLNFHVLYFSVRNDAASLAPHFAFEIIVLPGRISYTPPVRTQRHPRASGIKHLVHETDSHVNHCPDLLTRITLYFSHWLLYCNLLQLSFPFLLSRHRPFSLHHPSTPHTKHLKTPSTKHLTSNMKIIIIGGGIAGLSTYLQLLKHLPPRTKSAPYNITIFESHRPVPKNPSQHPSSHPVPQESLSIDALSSSTALVGGGLGISPNGCRVLRRLDEGLYKAFVAQGFRAEKFVFHGANGWVLGKNSTSDKVVRGEESAEEEVCISTSRHGLWEVLRRGVEERDPGAVRYVKVLGVEKGEGGKVFVKYEDEEGVEGEEEADLVVGADGVRSVVRKAVFGEKFAPEYR